jgi:4-hydroxyphenylpyruvate dioxygenase-like putative hemolysin
MSSSPILKRITQVAMVVKDCHATARRYWEDLGIGPWQFYTLDPSNTPNMTLRGKPVAHAFRAALATIGDVALELIEPLQGDSLYAEHLAAHGEGLHHVAFSVDDFERTKAHLKERGYREIQGGRPFDVITYAYFDTDKGLSCLTELGSELEEGRFFPAPEFTYP